MLPKLFWLCTLFTCEYIYNYNEFKNKIKNNNETHKLIVDFICSRSVRLYEFSWWFVVILVETTIQNHKRYDGEHFTSNIWIIGTLNTWFINNNKTPEIHQSVSVMWERDDDDDRYIRFRCVVDPCLCVYMPVLYSHIVECFSVYKMHFSQCFRIVSNNNATNT